MEWDFFKPIDIYCERLDTSYWAEPVNALTNVAFIAAGLYGLYLARKAGSDLIVKVLCFWVLLIGLGSYLFHTHANVWSVLADVFPIWSFFLLYVGFALRRYLALSWVGVGIGFLIGVALIVGTGQFIPESWRAATNGSIEYLPAILALLVFSITLWVKKSPAALYVLSATLVFALSITLRSLDMVVCDFPLGVHFLWHILNGVMLGILLVAAVRVGGQPSKTVR